MKVVLTRYYGDDVLTKSRMWVLDEDGTELMQCEAREARFVEYTEYFKGCSKVCLPVGVFEGRVVGGEMSPVTLGVMGAPGHRGLRFAYSVTAQARVGAVLVGVSDGYEDVKWRRMVDEERTFMRLVELLYGVYLRGERIEVEVRNEMVEGRDRLDA